MADEQRCSVVGFTDSPLIFVTYPSSELLRYFQSSAYADFVMKIHPEPER
jgi:hypothetical protein